MSLGGHLFGGGRFPFVREPHDPGAQRRGLGASVERSGDVAEAPLRRDQAAFDLVKAGDDRVIRIVLAALGDTGDP